MIGNGSCEGLGWASVCRRCGRGGLKGTDTEELAEVVGEAGQQVLAGGASEPAQAEGGEAARLLELAEDRLDAGLPAGVASASVRLAQLEPHGAGRAGALRDQEPTLLAGLQAAGTERAGRAVLWRCQVAVLAGTPRCAVRGDLAHQ